MSAPGRDAILALDTATPVGSVALCAAEGIVVSRYFDVGLQHSQRLFNEVEAALEAADMDVEGVRAIAVAIGPGSFTGLRIGLSAAKGLCLAAGKDLVTVSTLEALAARLPFARLPVSAVLDARKREVYAALYDTATGVPVELVPAPGPSRQSSWPKSGPTQRRFTPETEPRPIGICWRTIRSRAICPPCLALVPTPGLLAGWRCPSWRKARLRTWIQWNLNTCARPMLVP